MVFMKDQCSFKSSGQVENPPLQCRIRPLSKPNFPATFVLSTSSNKPGGAATTQKTGEAEKPDE